MRSSLLVRESRREAVPSLTLRASGLRGVGPLVLSPRADLRRGILPRPRAHEVQGGEGQQPRNEARVSFDGVLWDEKSNKYFGNCVFVTLLGANMWSFMSCALSDGQERGRVMQFIISRRGDCEEASFLLLNSSCDTHTATFASPVHLPGWFPAMHPLNAYHSSLWLWLWF